MNLTKPRTFISPASFLVNLTAFRITGETRFWVYLGGRFLERFSPTVDVGGAVWGG